MAKRWHFCRIGVNLDSGEKMRTSHMRSHHIRWFAKKKYLYVCAEPDIPETGQGNKLHASEFLVKHPSRSCTWFPIVHVLLIVTGYTNIEIYWFEMVAIEHLLGNY